MRTFSIRIRYVSLLTLLLIAAHGIFFIILCVVEFHESILDPSTWAESLEEIAFFFGVGVISLPLSIVIAWRVTRSLLKPLNGMIAVAERIRGGNFDERLEVKGTSDELDRLATHFNSAFDRYVGVVDRLKAFNADAAHQLRTPLTVIQSTCEVTLLHERERAAYERALQDILEEAHSLSSSVDQLLLLARMNADRMRQLFAEIDLLELIQRSANRFRPLLADKNITLHLNVDPNVKVWGDAILCEQALNNLMDNAIRFSVFDGSIWIDAVESGARVYCAVEDSGPGLSPDLQKVVFKRFQRDKSMGGSGLGLSIAHEIMTAHGGELRVERGPRVDGARFIFDLLSVRRTALNLKDS
jgi:signal transduction histidine kinase